MVLSFLLVFSISVCHCLKSVTYNVCACVCACVRACVCDARRSKIKIIWFLQNALQQLIKKPLNQKFERTYIGSTIKIAPFQEGDLQKKNLVGANAVEMEHFHCYVNVVNYKDIYEL